MLKKHPSEIKSFLNKHFVQECDASKDWQSNDDYYEWYYTYGRTFRPKSFLEMGVRFGYSFAAILKGCLDAGFMTDRAVGVDLEIHNPGSNAIALKNLQSVFPETRIELFARNASDVGRGDYGTFSMIHMDANHNEESLKNFDSAWDCLESDGILVIDDMTSQYSVLNPGFCTIERQVVGSKIEEYYYSGLIESYCYVNSLRGHCLLRKK